MKRHPITYHLWTARQRPRDWIALRFKRHRTWLELNWTEYYDRVDAAAQGLRRLDVRRGDRVVILSHSRMEWAILDMAVMALGAITVPIYHSNGSDEIEFILKQVRPKVLVLEDSVQRRKWDQVHKRLPDFLPSVVVIDHDAGVDDKTINWDDLLKTGTMRPRAQSLSDDIAQTELHDVATIVYTSGTTGQPKGVVLTHAQILSEVEDITRVFPISPADGTLTFLPLAHVLGRVELWLNVYVGFTLSFAESLERLRPNLLEVRPTVLIGVPRVFEKIHAAITLTPRKLFAPLLRRRLREVLGGRLRFVVSGGAALDRDIAAFYQRCGVLLLEGYGLTETTAAITANTPTAYEFGTVGRPLPDVEIKLNPDGEILVRSHKLFTQYFGDKAATREAYEDGFFKTGDIGAWTQRGFLTITDRKRDLIKTSGGLFVAPQKLEGRLRRDPLISRVLIHAERRKSVVALITLNEATLKALAKQNRWTYRDYRALTQRPEVVERVKAIVTKTNQTLLPYENIKNFAVLPEEFTVEQGELSPSLKLKRKFLEQKHKDILHDLST